MGSLDIIQKSIAFLLENSGKKARDIDKIQLRTSVAEIEKNAVNGLGGKHIEELASNVVFKDGYDITTRRKILYSLLPIGEDFPYQIIPLAISCMTVVPVNPSWQYTVLSWLGGLLEYCVIDPHNRYVHICYSAIFNLSSKLNLVLLVCKILGHLTNRSDVTEHRTKALLRLKEKAGFYEKVSQLLRLYQLFRPDLVVGKLSPRYLVQNAPRNLKIALLALRERLQESTEREFFASDQGIWSDIQRAEKANPYLRPTAIPNPNNNYYAETMEEKTKKVVFVSQYRKFSELVRGLPEYKYWKWPNNPATHLRSPVIISLFRPHEETVLVGITNWLDIALRTELIDGLGNPSNERCEKLLKAIHSLVKVTGSHIPVINHFLAMYITVWDQSSHFETVLSLLECVTYTSPEFVSDTLFKLVTDLLDHASMVKWCRVVEAVSKTAGSWAVKAHSQSSRQTDSNIFNWPDVLIESMDAAIFGLWYLTSRMELLFSVAIMEYASHPMVVNQILDFYIKVNMHTDTLNLPVVFLPPVPVIVLAIMQCDLVVAHRLGIMLSRLPASVERIKQMRTHGADRDVQEECLSMCESFNQSVILFIKGVFYGSVGGKTFHKALDAFYSFESLPDILRTAPAKGCASIIYALPYLPFFAKSIAERDTPLTKSEEKSEIKQQVLAELKDSGLSGIEECLNTYTKV